MSKYNRNSDAASTADMLKIGASLLATAIGIIAILMGLVCAVKTFDLIFDAFKHPVIFQEAFDQWVLVVGGADLDLQLLGNPYPVARILTVIVLGGGVVLLTWLSLGIMLVGAKIVSWTSSEKEAIKKILAYTFGSENVKS